MKDERAKEIFSDNNIMKHRNILLQVLFAASRVGFDFQYNILYMQVTQRFAKRLKTQYQEHLKITSRKRLLPSLPSRNKSMIIAVKNYADADIKVFGSCSILLNFFTLSHQFFRDCTAQKMKFHIKDFFSKYDQIRSFQWIWSRLLKKSLM